MEIVFYKYTVQAPPMDFVHSLFREPGGRKNRRPKRREINTITIVLDYFEIDLVYQIFCFLPVACRKKLYYRQEFRPILPVL